MLRDAKSTITVIAFIILNAKTSNYNVDALRGQAVNKLLTYVLVPGCAKGVGVMQDV